MWRKIKNLLKKSAGHSDVCRNPHYGLHTKAKEDFSEMLQLEKEEGGSVMVDLQRLIEKHKKEIAQLEAKS